MSPWICDPTNQQALKGRQVTVNSIDDLILKLISNSNYACLLRLNINDLCATFNNLLGVKLLHAEDHAISRSPRTAQPNEDLEELVGLSGRTKISVLDLHRILRDSKRGFAARYFSAV